MQKITTSLNKTDLQAKKAKETGMPELKPSEKTLQNILQFAAAYRVQKVNDNQFVEMLLN